ncbi:uncharacterized protein LOC142349818 [Convolutriloba macropyga]|uniref:uncharacterized protein LOC142349818 n=1 Tax=Convolutriloba macropyga TaxID=536237 RepID=UPI003F51D6DF
MNSPGRLIPEVEYYQGSRYKLENRLLSPDDVKELGNALATNSVRALSLQGVQLDDQSFRRICSSIGVCQSLCSLNLSDNVVRNHARVEALCECLNINRCLTALFMQGTPLEPQNIALLCRAIKLHPTIRTLDLTNCSLNDISLRYLTSLLPSEKGRDALEDLSIGSNPNVTPVGWQHFSMAVADNSCLRSLQLYFNNLGDHAACLLMVAISASKSIVSLDLENTNIGNQTAETLLQLITDFPNHLRDVNLTGNAISKDILIKIKNRMSIHHAVQGGQQNFSSFENQNFAIGQNNNSFPNEGPSAPYYIPSHGVTNRPQTVPEVDEEESEDFETPRENPDTARARSLLRNQLQQKQREQPLMPTDNDSIESQRSEFESNIPEKPLSPPVTARRIGTAIPGSRRTITDQQSGAFLTTSPIPTDLGSGRKSAKSQGATPEPTKDDDDPFQDIPRTIIRGSDSPFSDVIVSEGAAMLDLMQNSNSTLQPEIQNTTSAHQINDPNFQHIDSRSNLGSAKIVEVTSDDAAKVEGLESTYSDEFPNKAKTAQSQKSGDPKPGSSQEKKISSRETSNVSTRTYTKSPSLSPDKFLSPRKDFPISPVQSPGATSQKPKSQASQRSQRKSPGLKVETIPRKDILLPPDSSRLQVSKSLSFEKSLKDKNSKNGLKKSSTETSIRRVAGVNKTSAEKPVQTASKELQEGQKVEESLQRDETELSNAYPKISFGVQGPSSETSSKEPSMEKPNESENQFIPGGTNFGVNSSKLRDPRLDNLRIEGRKNSSSTIASSYGGIQQPEFLSSRDNLADFAIHEANLSDKDLGDVLRNSQVQVSNRMVDHGLNGDFVKTQRDLSEESIPKSLKSLLSRNNSNDVVSEINTKEHFTENPDNYLYANRRL